MTDHDQQPDTSDDTVTFEMTSPDNFRTLDANLAEARNPKDH